MIEGYLTDSPQMDGEGVAGLGVGRKDSTPCSHSGVVASTVAKAP